MKIEKQVDVRKLFQTIEPFGKLWIEDNRTLYTPCKDRLNRGFIKFFVR